MRDVVIVAGARTPVGAFGGSLKSLPVVQLGALALKEVLKKAGLRPVASEAMTRVEPDAISGLGWHNACNSSKCRHTHHNQLIIKGDKNEKETEEINHKKTSVYYSDNPVFPGWDIQCSGTAGQRILPHGLDRDAART